MRGYGVIKPSNKIVKFMFPVWKRQIWLYSKNELNLKNHSYQSDMYMSKNWMHGNDVNEVFYLICKIHDPCDRGLGPKVGPILLNGENVLIL